MTETEIEELKAVAYDAMTFLKDIAFGEYGGAQESYFVQEATELYRNLQKLVGAGNPFIGSTITIIEPSGNKRVLGEITDFSMKDNEEEGVATKKLKFRAVDQHSITGKVELDMESEAFNALFSGGDHD